MVGYESDSRTCSCMMRSISRRSLSLTSPSLTSPATSSDRAETSKCSDADCGDAGSKRTSPLKSRTPMIGLCPKADSNPPAVTRTVNRLGRRSRRYVEIVCVSGVSSLRGFYPEACALPLGIQRNHRLFWLDLSCRTALSPRPQVLKALGDCTPGLLTACGGEDYTQRESSAQ